MKTPSAGQIDQALYVAAQLQPDDMPAIAAAGFRSIINNRPDHEAGAGEPTSAQLEAAARGAKLECRYIPVPAGHEPEQAQSMASAVVVLPTPVLASCRTGRRSAALYRISKGGA